MFGIDGLNNNIFCLPCEKAPGQPISPISKFLESSKFETHNLHLSSVGFTFSGSFILDKLKSFLVDILYESSIANSRQVQPDSMKSTHFDLKPSTQSFHHSLSSKSNEELLDITLSFQVIYRVKGIFQIHGYSKLFILQSVHDIFDLQPSSYETNLSTSPSKDHTSRVIIIGHHLKSDIIYKRLSECLFTE